MNFRKFVGLVCLITTCFLSTAYCQTGGLDSRPEVAPFLDGNFPSLTPNPLNQDAGAWSVVNAFPNLEFQGPMQMLPVPRTTNQLLLMQKSGQLVTFINDPATTTKTTLLDIQPNVQWYGDSGFLGLAFHPEYGVTGSPNNSYIYVYYRWQPELLQGNLNPAYMRLSRFTWVPGSNRIDPQSELVLINQFDAHNWHQGGGMFFGEDGFLYLAVGDEGLANDSYDVAQKLDLGLFAGVLRIDVDMDASRSHPIRRQPQADEPQPSGWTEGTYSQNYYIPDDNPWQDPNGGILEEFYALGLRNPHKMTWDALSGQIWISDVGQGTREELDLLEKGANYEWPYKEGAVNGAKSPPATIYGTETGPVHDYGRSVGGCVIGGYVYRGQLLPPLQGKYIFADYNKGTIFALEDTAGNGPPIVTQLTDIQEHAIYGFGTDHDGEVYVMRSSVGGNSTGVVLKFNFDGSASSTPEPPLLLSQTNAFTDLATLTPATGLIPYDVIQPLWSDGAGKQRWLSIPHGPGVTDDTITFSELGNWIFPNGSILVKHFEKDGRRLETRFMIKDENGSWYGVTYQWNEAGTDANLLTSDVGFSEVYDINGEDFIWHYPSRNECFTCHTSVKGRVLGVKTRHLNTDILYPETGRTANQLVTLNQLGIFDQTIDETTFPDMLTAANVTDISHTKENRFRSYIDINCSQCHTNGGIPHANFEASMATPLFWQNTINAEPLNNLGIAGSKVVYPGDESLSILYHRLTSLEGCCAMPPLAKNAIDQDAADLVQSWIQSLVPTEVPQSDVDPTSAPDDTVPPSVTMQVTGTMGQVMATFSESVEGLSSEEIEVTNGAITSFSGSGSTRSITVAIDGPGEVGVTIPADTFHDVNGNANPAAASVQFTTDASDQGLKYEYYEGNFLSLPDFPNLTPVSEGFVSNVDLSPRQRDDLFAMRFTGQIAIDTAGDYQFHLSSDDGSRLIINGTEIINYDGLHAADTVSGQITLAAGMHDLEIQYFEYYGGEELQLEIEGPGLARQPVSSDILTTPVSVPLPPVTVDPGATGGLTYQYYEGFFQSLPNFDTLNVDASGSVPTIDLSPRLRDDFFAMRFNGFISVPTTGTYTFYLESDDGSRLKIGSETLIDKDGLYVNDVESAEITLGAGAHPILLEYFERDGNEFVNLEIEGPGLPRQAISLSQLVSEGPPAPVEPDTAPALNYTYYEGNFQSLPDFGTLTPLETGVVYVPDLSPRQRDSQFAMQFTGVIRIPATGDYQFHLSSDDGSRLTIDSSVVIDNDGFHGTETVPGTVTLTEGDHSFVLDYFEGFGDQVLALEIEGPGMPRQNVPASLFVDPNAPINGLTYQYYEGNYSLLPDFSSLSPVKVGMVDAPSLSPRLRDDQFAMRFAGKLRVPTDGSYSFFLSSDDGSRLSINNTTVIDHDGLHSAFAKAGNISLTAGEHDFILEYFESYGEETLLVEIEGPGIPRQIMDESFFREEESEFSVQLTTSSGQVNNNFSVDISFSEDASGLSLADFQVTNGTASGLSSISASEYFVLITPAATGAVTVQLPAGAAQATGGQDSTASNVLSVYYDPNSQPSGGGPVDLEDSLFQYSQSWTSVEGDPVSFTREAMVQVPENATGKLPVVILLHGTGAQAVEMINTFAYLEDMIKVAPQGYQADWNISHDEHYAPDVDFIRQIIYTLRTYDNVDAKQIAILGYSNGAGLVNRLIIELEEDLFTSGISLSQQLRHAQYRDGSFWWDPNGNWDYTEQITPAQGRRILTIHGSDDTLLPYEGKPGDPLEDLWLHNLESIYRFAEAMGHTGPQLQQSDGVVDGSALKFSYLNDQVIHYQLVGGDHFLDIPGEGTAKTEQIILDFLGQTPAP